MLKALPALLFFWSWVASAQTPKLPALDRPVVDTAGIISATDAERLGRRMYELHAQGGPQVGVLAVESLQGLAIEDFSIRAAEQWKLGSQTKGNGLLLLIAPKEREVRIEVGQGIEGEITDYDSDKWIRHVMTPYFRQGDYAGAVDAWLDQVAEKFGIAPPEGRTVRRVARGRREIHPLAVIILVIILLVLQRFRGRGMVGGFGGGYRRGGFGGYGGGGGFGGGGSWGGGGGGFSGGGSSGRW